MVTNMFRVETIDGIIAQPLPEIHHMHPITRKEIIPLLLEYYSSIK
jgi:hypothetical protein